MIYDMLDLVNLTARLFSLTLQMLSFNFHKSEAQLFDEPITLEARNKFGFYQVIIYKKMQFHLIYTLSMLFCYRFLTLEVSFVPTHY